MYAVYMVGRRSVTEGKRYFDIAAFKCSSGICRNLISGNFEIQDGGLEGVETTGPVPLHHTQQPWQSLAQG